MVCYGPRLSTVIVACAAAYALLHQVIGDILHIAGLVMQAVLITSVAVAAAVLLTRTVRGIQRRRAAAGACTTCRFRCQQPLDLRPQPRPARAGHGDPVLLPVPLVPRAVITQDGYLLTPDGVTGTSTGRPGDETAAPAEDRPLVLD
jgi:hypothetical protein